MGLQNADFGPLIWLKPKLPGALPPAPPPKARLLDPIFVGLNGKPLKCQTLQKILHLSYTPRQQTFLYALGKTKSHP